MDMSEFTNGPLTLEEMIKIISLLENPADAREVRRALRFYQVPENLEFKWADGYKVISTLKHYENPQNPWELAQMQRIIKENGCKSLLEIGSSFGGTLKRLVGVMPKGSQVVSVDLPIDETPKYLNPLDSLKESCRQLMKLGAQVELIIGNSHSKQVVNIVENYGPYDFIFIDGDHSYDGMKQDWENYGPMGRIVAFHDIGGNLPECTKMWEEIKASGAHVEEYIVADAKPRFGIGVVYRE